MHILGKLKALVAATALAAFHAQAAAVTELDRGLGSLIEAFNSESEKVRLVFIVGPTCPVCRKGLEEMNSAVLPRMSEDSDLTKLVVQVPALDAQAEDVASASALLGDDRSGTNTEPVGSASSAHCSCQAMPGMCG